METTDSTLYQDKKDRVYLDVKHPIYMNCENRFKTFQEWPSFLNPSAKDLSYAGFVYTGRGDVVYCFCCGVQLKNWEPTDQAWGEHFRYSPTCSYLKMCKIQRFDQPANMGFFFKRN